MGLAIAAITSIAHRAPRSSFQGISRQVPGETPLEEGSRATPSSLACGPHSWIAAATQGFWQNFPKALRWSGAALEIGLFPTEARKANSSCREGSRSATRCWWISQSGTRATLDALQQPLRVCARPGRLGRVRGAPSPGSARHSRRHVGSQRTCCRSSTGRIVLRQARDHRRVRLAQFRRPVRAITRRCTIAGPGPLRLALQQPVRLRLRRVASHFLRTGDARWRELMQDAARHHVDIDIYHTQTTSRLSTAGCSGIPTTTSPRATCTHRTYSRHNAGAGGLWRRSEQRAQLHLRSVALLLSDGRPRSRAAPSLGLADWVLAMDDGARTLFGADRSGPTGLGEQDRGADSHKPGRGAGNSINALLDAYALTASAVIWARPES